MQQNRKSLISEIEYIPVDEEREQIRAVIELLVEQLVHAGVDRSALIIRYGEDER